MSYSALSKLPFAVEIIKHKKFFSEGILNRRLSRYSLFFSRFWDCLSAVKYFNRVSLAGTILFFFPFLLTLVCPQSLLDCLEARLSKEPRVCDVSSMPQGLEGKEHFDFPLKDLLKNILLWNKYFYHQVLDFAEMWRRKSAAKWEWGEKRL